ncbi:translation initiation factor 2 [Kitasatospora sp. RB6PN24]|uniref:translation initiation factor 2 n=1 Tax=Kitasatospora humi TaxID=2893891 RepID=UPI001E389346|nr:translation initiation factor 2 [Kitasatospora humi]MCC9306579.1 translation initiation factor 2 [Kitasatospora humi]
MLVAVRSATALHRLLDVLPVFDGDDRIATRFTLVPGSDFDVDALTALEHTGARLIPWNEARHGSHDLVLTASPKGAVWALSGPRVLLPHGAGFNKAISGDGSPGIPSGLDPHYLLADGEPWASLHALAHGDQLARLTEHCPQASARAVVVGDPTLDRILASAIRREDYRAALGTGDRRLVALTASWGPESLLARRPGLPAELVGALPHDDYQFALVLHPNEYSRIGEFDLARQLAPALAAGLVLARPHQEWAALLIAADAVITDHGSTALYAAALGRPVVGAYDGGEELVPGSPMADLLAKAPHLVGPADLPESLRRAVAQDSRTIADAAFALPGDSLARLRHELYGLLRLEPRSGTPTARQLPPPVAVPHPPSAFAVLVPRLTGHRITVERYPAHHSGPVHHRAAAHPDAGLRQVQSAAVLWRRARRDSVPTTANGAWTAAGWTARVLEELPGRRTAAAILDVDRCLIRHHRAGLVTVRIEPSRADGRVRRADPTAVVSAVHAWLGANSEWTGATSLDCTVGGLTVRVELTTPDPADLDHEL